jgi:hypothetical protein
LNSFKSLKRLASGDGAAFESSRSRLDEWMFKDMAMFNNPSRYGLPEHLPAPVILSRVSSPRLREGTALRM